MVVRSGCRAVDGRESGRDGKACDGLPTGGACVGVLPSGRGGTDDGCIGGPGLVGLVSCCDGVDALVSNDLAADFRGSLSLEGGAGVAGVEALRFSPLSSSRAGILWTPLLEDTDQSHC
jgi:hypothetical protein